MAAQDREVKPGMKWRVKQLWRGGVLMSLACAALVVATGWTARAQSARDNEFGPVVRAYLGYLRAQQEVVDDRVSRREIDRAYYMRNSNRIHALRAMAIRIARETNNDFLPELEAVALDEFDQLFDVPPRPETLQVDGLLDFTFRYLGAVRHGRDKFYVFARLDPYEQVEVRKKAEANTSNGQHSSASPTPGDAPNRPRRVNVPD